MTPITGSFAARPDDDTRRRRGDAAIYRKLPLFRRRAEWSLLATMIFAVLVMLFLATWGLWRCLENARGMRAAKAQMVASTAELKFIARQ